MSKLSAEALLERGEARCSRCDRVFRLVHPTKQHPHGARLHAHKFNYRACYGSPIQAPANDLPTRGR